MKTCPNLRFEYGHYYQTAANDAQHWSRPFDNYKSKIFALRIQGCLRMVPQGSQRNTSLYCSTLDWIKYNNTAFPLEPISDESQLCRCGQIGFGQTFDYKFHCFSGRNNLAFAHCGGPKEKWKAVHLHQFQEIKCNCKKRSILSAIYGGGFGYGS